MNKKEISEIKKQLKPEYAVITKICGCYVDGDKEIKFTSKDEFHSLSDVKAFKYFEIFRHTLSGTLGKNLLDIEFPLVEEAEGGRQEFLLKLRDSKLEDDSLLEEFYQNVINHYVYESNYYIILIHGVYDVPGKSSDGSEMFDASDSVYDYILCSICPVNLSKSGLSYDKLSNNINECNRDWIVKLPADGFLFPAFNNRESDTDSILYFSKDDANFQAEFLEHVLGAEVTAPASFQKKVFHAILSEELGKENGFFEFDNIKSIYENLHTRIEENKDRVETLELKRNDIRQLLEDSNVSERKIKRIEEKLELAFGKNPTLIATNILDTKKLQIETAGVKIIVNTENTELVDSCIIDGSECIVIKVNGDITINDVKIDRNN
ncbi:MAG: DUF4317 domain-containing protein [Lachnospiraceae bacterium]|nr:DUF4317 domain-containing protein [Lachnospiraceae bacterium]